MNFNALIRLLDLAGYCGWRWLPAARGTDDFLNDQSTVGKQYLGLNIRLGVLALGYESGVEGLTNINYSGLVNSIIHCAKINNYDIEAAMIEKVEYNKNRADHKRENRAKSGGKKF